MAHSRSSNSSPARSPVAPHRGFNQKAREVLLDPPHVMAAKSNSDFDLRKRLVNSCASLLRRTDSQATNGSQGVQSNKSQSSTHSVPEEQQVAFDEIGEMPKALKGGSKNHKLLGELGKTRSAGDVLKNVDKSVFRTFQQQNILKLPSVDSDLEVTDRQRVLAHIDDLYGSMGMVLNGEGRSEKYVEGAISDTKRADIAKWLEKANQ